MFSSAGISELLLEELGIQVVCANEIIPARANLYSSVFERTRVINGDITSKEIFNKIMEVSNNLDLIIASPPCQGMSIAGKNRNPPKMILDKRNYFIYQIIHFIKKLNPNFIFIENVPLLLNLQLPYNSQILNIIDILHYMIGDKYHIEDDLMNARDFGVPQNRKRAIIRIYKKGLDWSFPTSIKKYITVKDSIGDLPSLEAGENSSIKWHYARKHTKDHILFMKNTPTGKSAFLNNKFYPKKKNGERIKGYDTTYRRMSWDEPAPTITIRNDAISSQRNVHPGRKMEDGTYSDARVLTPLELMRLSSIPENWSIPNNTNELLIRKCIGECVPPLMTKAILSGIIK